MKKSHWGILVLLVYFLAALAITRSNMNYSSFRLRKRKKIFQCKTWRCVKRKSTRMRYKALVREVMNPFSPWFLSDLYYGDELFQHFGSDVQSILNSKPLNTSHCKFIHGNSVVFVDTKLFPQFVKNCIPLIQNRIILLTGRWQLPMIHESNLTNEVLNNPRIVHWFSQNPMLKHPKYTGIPYGVHQGKLKTLLRIVNEDRNKTKIIRNLFLEKTNDEREEFIGGKKLPHRIYCRKIKTSKFLISPIGDRPDTYRHWESIALGTVPICNCPDEFKDLFKGNGIVASKQEMLKWMSDSSELENRRIEFSPNILSAGFWDHHIRGKAGYNLDVK